jgi:hypothetical protein
MGNYDTETENFEHEIDEVSSLFVGYHWKRILRPSTGFLEEVSCECPIFFRLVSLATTKALEYAYIDLIMYVRYATFLIQPTEKYLSRLSSLRLYVQGVCNGGSPV